MDRRTRIFSGMLSSLLLATGMAMADGRADAEDASYCMDVNIGGFHMMPGYMDPAGACAVKDYWGGELQEAFYPFTKEDHLFNCDYFADVEPYYGTAVTLPNGAVVPSSVVSQEQVTGTIGGHPFSARLYCASLTNWYQEFCADPYDKENCFQLAQTFLRPPEEGDFYPRVTEVSLFDGVITVERRRKSVEVPIVLATRAAGMTHVESLDPPQVGASVTHSALGMLTYETDGDDVKVLGGSLDLLLQGHIFHPASVEEDPKAAVIKGTICSKDLYRLLNQKGGKGGKGQKGGRGKDHHDD